MTEINHTDRKHAFLSASGSSRWINCTPSPRLEENIPDSGSSVYAQEGTLAHEFADIYLQKAVGLINMFAYRNKVNELKKSPLYKKEMDFYVEVYTNYVLSQYELPNTTHLLIEERLDFSNYVEGGFGTGDSVLLNLDQLEIVDLKYGKGVEVSPIENEQLMLYGLGALNRFDLTHDVNEVKLTIVQPRRSNLTSWTISANELIEWGENVVKPAAIKAHLGEGEQIPGKWCKWCKVKPKCKALHNLTLDVAKHEFEDPKFISKKDMVSIYKNSPVVEDFLKSIKLYLLTEMINGENFEGLKVVEGKSNRKWKNEEEVIKVINEELDLETSEYIKTKLAGITEISQLVTVDAFEELLKPLIIKPRGNPIVVDSSDKRKHYSNVDSAKEDFS